MSELAEVKKCPSCGIEKTVSEFRKNKARVDGLSFYCKSCFAQRDKEAYRRRQLAKGKELRDRPEVPEGHKYCASCKQIKPHAEWHRSSYQAGGLAPYCKECKKAKGSAAYFKRQYGLTPEQVEEMASQQGSRCLICCEGPAEHVDHDHVTGNVRGMLCFSCNAAIGHLKERPEVMQRAIRYVQGRLHDDVPRAPALAPDIYFFAADRRPRIEFDPSFPCG